MTSLLGLTGLGVGSFLIGISPSDAYGLAVAGLALVCMMNTFANGPFFAILHSIVPPEMQGRVFTVLMTVSMAMAPFGLALAGPLSDGFGVQLWYVLGALICCLMVTWSVLSPGLLHLEEEQMHPAVAVESASE